MTTAQSKTTIEIYAPNARDFYPSSPAHALRSLLMYGGISQREAAKAIGIDERTMRRYVDRKNAGHVPYPVLIAIEVLALARRRERAQA